MVIAVIPARLGARRLPRKPLAELAGLPLVEHVRRRVLRSRVDRVIVATDDAEIADVVASFGGEVARTGPATSGTDRVFEAVREALPDRVINVQGDMPLVEPAHVDRVVALLDAAEVATLAAPLRDPSASAVVKVVTDAASYALYFSRAPIPVGGPWWRHVGLYGFHGAALARCASLPPSALERSEDLEQLRWLEAGVRIRVGQVEAAEDGVDTPNQLAALQRRFASGELRAPEL